MEWLMPVNEMLREDITRFTNTLLPPGFHGDIRSVRLMRDSLARVIDALGGQSAAAQGLNKVITTAEKLRNSPNNILYLLKDSGANGGKGEAVGFLKVGRKHLFLYDERDTVHELEPLCVLDFYVRGDRQRCGLGKKLFDHMLKEEGARAEQLAIDGPSPKMEQFLRKNYNVDRLFRQCNNFAVSPHFFTSGELPVSGRGTPVAAAASVGRFSAPKPPSAIGSVIHGSGSDGYYQENSRGSSRVCTPDLHTPEPDFLLERPPSPQPNPERPTTLQVVTVQPPPLSPGMESTSPSRRASQLTDRGHFDIKFYHNKLW